MFQCLSIPFILCARAIVHFSPCVCKHKKYYKSFFKLVRFSIVFSILATKLFARPLFAMMHVPTDMAAGGY